MMYVEINTMPNKANCCFLEIRVSDIIKNNNTPKVGITTGCKIADINLCQRIKFLYEDVQQVYLTVRDILPRFFERLDTLFLLKVTQVFHQ